MTIQEIKDKFGLPRLELRYATDVDGNVDQEWLRHWDNDNRIAISVHKDTVAEIKVKNPNYLGLQHEIAEGAQGAYQRFRIVAFTPADVVL